MTLRKVASSNFAYSSVYSVKQETLVHHVRFSLLYESLLSLDLRKVKKSHQDCKFSCFLKDQVSCVPDVQIKNTQSF